MDTKNLAGPMLVVLLIYLHYCTSLPTLFETSPKETEIFTTDDPTVSATTFRNVLEDQMDISMNNFESNGINILEQIATLYSRASVSMQKVLQIYNNSGLYTPDQHLTTYGTFGEKIMVLSNISYAIKTSAVLGCESIRTLQKINASVQYRRMIYQPQSSDLHEHFTSVVLNHINNIVQLTMLEGFVKCDNHSDEKEDSRLLDYDVMTAMNTMIAKFQLQSKSLEFFTKCDLHGEYKRLRSRADASIREAVLNYCNSSSYDKSSSLKRCGDIFSIQMSVPATSVCVHWDTKKTYAALCKARALLNETKVIISLRAERKVNVNYIENDVMNIFHILQLDASCNIYTTTSRFTSCGFDIQVCLKKVFLILHQVDDQRFL